MSTRITIRSTMLPAVLLGTLLAWQNSALAADVFYSGRALGFHATINAAGATKKLTLAKNDMSCQGLPDEETVSGIETRAPLGVHARTITTFTQGKDGVATSNAATEKLSLDLPGLRISADVLDAFVETRCEGGKASTTGNATIANVVINGEAQQIGAEPNQTIEIPDVATIIFNEQALFQRGGRVTALHIKLANPDFPANGDIVVSAVTTKISSCAAVCTP